MEFAAHQQLKSGDDDEASPAPLSVVMPAYNEEGAIREAVAEVAEEVFSVVRDAELIVVNDGSRDSTGAILDALAQDDPRIKPLHQTNGGHGRAVMAGISAARGEMLLLLDSDRQIALDRFGEHWRLSFANDAVFGTRRVRHDPALRLVLTRVVRNVLALVFNVRIRDANVPYKLFPRSAWLQAQAIIPRDTLAPSLFLALFLKKAGYRVAEVEIEHRPRLTGISIRRWRLIKFCTKALGQLLRFRLRLLNVHKSEILDRGRRADRTRGGLATTGTRTSELAAR